MLNNRLPEGYAARGGRLALNVKVYRSATAAECAEVAEELGAADGGFGPEWIDARSRQEEDGQLETWAAEAGFEAAEELARELFGRDVNVGSDGRSGGWLVLGREAPDAQDAEVALAVASDPRPTDGEEEGVPTPDEGRELLARLERFRAGVAELVAEHPRRVAWQYCANAYLPMREAAEAEARRKAAAERLELATAAMRDAALQSTMIDAPTPDVRGVVAEYDAARAAFEDEGGGA